MLKEGPLWKLSKLEFFSLALILAPITIHANDFNANEQAVAEAKLIWPTDPLGRLWEYYSATVATRTFASVWPKSEQDICLESLEKSADLSGEPSAILILIQDECQKKKTFPASVALDLGAYPINKRAPFSTPFEVFAPGWESVHIDPEMARAWSDVPDLIKVELQYSFSPHSYAYFRMGLHRDIKAWYQDPLGSNVPLSSKEVDLNEPSLGYFHIENNFLDFTVGRFPIHWSPSPDFGLTLSDGVPYHDAVQVALKAPVVRYYLLVSSLNPWLQGTPLGDTASENYPVGSEEYLQRHYDSQLDQNAHSRVYADNIKTLFAHRLEANFSRLNLGITETQIIGGKVPDLRDAGPFIFYHNTFREGYTNINLSFDAKLRLPGNISLFGETILDDIRYVPTEGKDGTPSIIGTMVGALHASTLGRWLFTQSAHWIHTDPYLYGYQQPLNTFYSRQVLTSNMQDKNERPFVDKFVVDFPIGYLRGGDDNDFWYHLTATLPSSWELSLIAGILAKGEVNYYTPYASYYNNEGAAPTGIPEYETRVITRAAYVWQKGVSVHGGAGWQYFENQNHLTGRTVSQFQLSTGVTWGFPR